MLNQLNEPHRTALGNSLTKGAVILIATTCVMTLFMPWVVGFSALSWLMIYITSRLLRRFWPKLLYRYP